MSNPHYFNSASIGELMQLMTTRHPTQVTPIGPLPFPFGCLQVGPCVMPFSRMVALWLDFLSTRLAPSNRPLVDAFAVAKWVSTRHGFVGTPLAVVCVATPMRLSHVPNTSPNNGNGKSHGNLLRRPQPIIRCKTATPRVGLLRNHEAQYSIWYDAPGRQPLVPAFVLYAIEFSAE